MRPKLILWLTNNKKNDILTDFTQKARVMKMKYCEGIRSFPAGENES